LSDDDICEMGPHIHTSGCRNIACDDHLRLKEDMYVCPRCLKKFKDSIDDVHIVHCHPRFSRPVFRKLSKLIVQVTPDSPETEKLISERLSKCSAIDQRYPHPVLRRNKWIRNGWYLRTFLLTDREEVASYIVVGHVDTMEQDDFGFWHRNIIADMFTASTHRKANNMWLLLPIALKVMHHTFETIWFQEPISEEGEKFLNKMSEVTGLPYRTC
jgi:hypothetical protein